MKSILSRPSSPHHHHCPAPTPPHPPTRFLNPPPHRSLQVQTPRIHTTLSAAALVLADAMQPKGDINVFLQTGGLMFSAYLVANFVVPSIVTKQLQTEESTPNESDDKSTTEEKLNAKPKKTNRGFNSTKP